MSLHLFRKSGKRGFTLVELLIVVAIIGVLSTIGVPTFRRMIQKSKKSEAKVVLGGLYTTEAAFNAEYNTYGNNLPQMGFEIEGQANPNSLTYMAGFFDNACALSPAAIQPSGAVPVVNALNAAFPAYYTTALNAKVGRNIAAGCYAAAPASGVTVNTTGANFTAVAAGNISPSNAARMDLWTINSLRNLSNVQDGIQ